MTDHRHNEPQARDQTEAIEDLRERALKALREGRFDLAEDLLANGDVSIELLLENVRVYQAELEIQNEELIRSQQVGAQALERFTALFHNAPIAEIVIDRHGLIVEANPTATQLFALRDPNAHHHFLLRLLAENDRNRFLDLVKTMTVGTEPSASCPQLHFKTTEGVEFIGDLHGARLPSTATGDTRLLCAIVDRTTVVRQKDELQRAYDRLASSQEAYHVLSEYSPDWDYWISPDGRFIHVSPGCREVTGYGAAAFLDDPGLLGRLLHPDDHPQWRRHLAQTKYPPGVRDEEVMLLRLRHRDGDWRWIEHECRPVIADDGRYLGRRGVNRDVTERQEAEASIRELRNMLVDAERIANAGAWAWERGDTHIQVSPGWQRIHAAERSTYTCQELHRYFGHPDDSESVEAAYQKALLDGQGYELEHRIRRGDDGSVRWVRTRAEVVRDEDGQILRVRGTGVDITNEVHAKSQLQESERRYRALFESAGEGMLVLQQGRVTAINAAALAMLGYEREDQVLGLSPDQLSPQTQPTGNDSAREVRRLLDEAAHKTLRFQWMHRQADGSPLPVEVTLVPVTLDGELAHFVHWHDRTQEAKARQREIQASTVFENTAEAIMITDPDQRILAVNRAFHEITGFSEDEVAGRSPAVLNSGHHDAGFFQQMWQAIEQTGSWTGELWNRRKDGEVYPARLTVTRVTDDAGVLTNYIGIFSDISEAKRSEDELFRLAHSDALTGLPNRALLRARMEQSLQRAKRDRRTLALLFIDLDLFKIVNDSLGHSTGDELLKEVARAIGTQVRAGDTIARLGGDEFVILMEDLDEPSTAAHLAQRLCDRIAHPFQVGERELRLTASIGVSLFPDDGDSMDALLSNADLAMYRAKDQGRNTYRFFEAEMTERAMNRLHLETALRGAIGRDELHLVYQPQFRLADGRMQGAEALLRWTHPDLGAVSPAAFIPIAEEIGLIGDLGRWVTAEACRQLARWDDDKLFVPRLSINVSVQQVEQLGFVDELKAIIDEAGVAADRLELEVTESVLMRNVERVIANLNAARELGVTLAVDDFGAGFSSLGYLKRLPISRLKIDKTFVDGVETDANDSAIARAIIALSRALGLEVIAEGVETETQARFLRDEGCDEVQGYLLGRPMDPEALRRLQLSAA